MNGTFADIETLADNLKKKGFELVKVQDPNRKQATQAPEHPAGGASSGSEDQDSLWAWKQAHGDGPGGIQVTIAPLHGKGPVSPFIDPGSVNADSPAIVDFMTKHAS